MEKPDRILEVNKEIEQFGARLLSQHAILDAYDFVNIVETPDNETIARLSLALGSRGTIEITTLPAMISTEFISKLKSDFHQ
jgi:uncharacterized protein with GYD domain